MRTLSIAALVACLLTAPASAQLERLHPVTGLELAQVPDADTRERIICEQTAARVDAAKRKGEKPAEHDQARLDHCLRAFECGKVYWAKQRGELPADARGSNLGMMRFIDRTCVLPK